MVPSRRRIDTIDECDLRNCFARYIHPVLAAARTKIKVSKRIIATYDSLNSSGDSNYSKGGERSNSCLFSSPLLKLGCVKQEEKVTPAPFSLTSAPDVPALADTIA